MYENKMDQESASDVKSQDLNIPFLFTMEMQSTNVKQRIQGWSINDEAATFLEEKIISLGIPEDEPLERAEQDMEYLTKKVMKDMWD